MKEFDYENRFLKHFARGFGVFTIFITTLYWMGLIPLPHPEWSNMTVRIGLPMVIGWVFVLFPVSAIRETIKKLIEKKWL